LIGERGRQARVSNQRDPIKTRSPTVEIPSYSRANVALAHYGWLSKERDTMKIPDYIAIGVCSCGPSQISFHAASYSRLAPLLWPQLSQRCHSSREGRRLNPLFRRAVSCLTTISGLNVRFGSKAEIEAPPPNVCFTPKSGHCRATVGCPLCATSRYQPNHSIVWSARPSSNGERV
jgi:hypothetical protein